MKSIFFQILILILLAFGCNSTEPEEVEQGELFISLKDKSCEEIWFDITIPDNSIGRELEFRVNDEYYRKREVNYSGDSTYRINYLLPDREYNIKAILHGNDKYNSIEAEFNASTMDTTSHDFSWEIFSFGEHSSSALYDVAIINHNNIWAVGEVFINDSSGGTDPLLYNVVHWDGDSWTLQRAETFFRNSKIVLPLKGIVAFSEYDIWLIGSLPIHGDGNSWTLFDLRTTLDPSIALYHAWGTSSNDIYFAGSSGSMAHFNGRHWEKIESGTDSDIQDIWGVTDGDKKIVACAVTNIYGGGDRKILLYVNGKEQDIFWPSGIQINSLWFYHLYRIFTAGSGIFVNNETGNWRQWPKAPLLYTEKIRGQEINDIFAVGHFGKVSHYNGYTWKIFSEVNADLFYSVSYKYDRVVAVGEKSGKAVILVNK